MRLSALMLALLLSGAGALVLSSCGGGSDAKLLPGATASQIESNLEEVRQLAAGHDCIGAEDAVAAVSAEVEELNGVAAKLKDALQEGTARLGEVVARCDEESEEEAEQAAEADVEAEEEVEAGELEAEEEKAAKAQEKAEKQAQKEEEKATPEVEEGEKSLPPQAEGKAKGHEEAAPPPAAEPAPEENESGGVGPGVGVE